MNINHLIRSTILVLLLSIHVMALTSNEEEQLIKDKFYVKDTPYMAFYVAISGITEEKKKLLQNLVN